MDYSKLNAKEINVMYMMLLQIDEPLRSSEDFRSDVFLEEFNKIFAEFISMNENDRCTVFSNLEREVNLRSYIDSIVKSDSSDFKDAMLKIADDLSKMDSKSIKNVVSDGIARFSNSDQK